MRLLFNSERSIRATCCPVIVRTSSFVNGWNRTTVKPGDVITGVGYQFSDGQKIIRLEHVVLPDGKKIRVYAR